MSERTFGALTNASSARTFGGKLGNDNKRQAAMKSHHKHRINNAKKILNLYEGAAARRTSMIDAITDLMHFAKKREIDFNDVLRMARDHFSSEDISETIRKVRAS